jgi:hypothetical protein
MPMRMQVGTVSEFRDGRCWSRPLTAGAPRGSFGGFLTSANPIQTLPYSASWLSLSVVLFA